MKLKQTVIGITASLQSADNPIVSFAVNGHQLPVILHAPETIAVTDLRMCAYGTFANLLLKTHSSACKGHSSESVGVFSLYLTTCFLISQTLVHFIMFRAALDTKRVCYITAFY